MKKKEDVPCWRIIKGFVRILKGKLDKQVLIHIREVVLLNPNMEKVIRTLIELLAEQEGASIEFTIEKTA